MKQKLVILDTIYSSVLIFNAPEVIADFFDYLIEENIISGMKSIHWQIMENVTINNFTK